MEKKNTYVVKNQYGNTVRVMSGWTRENASKEFERQKRYHPFQNLTISIKK